MAVNADTFGSGPQPIGSSGSVLVPAADESPAPGLGDDAKGTSGGKQGDDSSGQTKPPAPGATTSKESSPGSSADNGSGSTPTTNHGSDDGQSDQGHDQEDD